MFAPKVSIAEQLNMDTNQKRSMERKINLAPKVQDIFNEMQAFTAYIEGAALDDITNKFGIKQSTLKYKMKKLKDYGLEGFLDLRDDNGTTQEKKITQEVGQRIQELKMSNPALGSREIAAKLYEQNALFISHTLVNEYLNDVNLSNYTGSEFWDSIFSP